MSDVKHAFRLMIIDIDADKVVADTFCDAIVAGLASKAVDGDGSEGKGTHSVLSASRCDSRIIVEAVMAAEEAVEKTKRKTVGALLKEISDGDVSKMINEIFGEGNDGCENS